VKCPECGNGNPPNVAYCEYCGHDLAPKEASRRTRVEPGQAAPARDASRRRTVYEPSSGPAKRGPSPPAYQQASQPASEPAPPQASPQATYIDDPFTQPLPRRAAYDPGDPFASALQGPPVVAAPPSKPTHNATKIDGPTSQQPLGAALVAYSTPDAPGVLHALRRGRNTVGRDASNDVSLPDGRVSSQHGFIFVRPDGASFIDVSTNGSLADGVALLGEQAALSHGSWLQIGDTRLVFVAIPVLPHDVWREP
jgi:predicted component of type VI protein secretion system